MLLNTEINVDQLAHEFQAAVNDASNHETPSVFWTHFFSEFITKVFTLCVDPSLTAEERTQFCLALTGPASRGIGSPFSSFEGFIVTANEDIIKRLGSTLERFQNILLKIQAKIGEHYLTSRLVTPMRLTGTPQKLLQIFSNAHTAFYAGLTGVPLYGKPQLLHALLELLKDAHPREERTRYGAAAFCYDMAVNAYDGAIRVDAINLQNDVMRPILAIIDGLRIEHGIATSMDPMVSVNDLRMRGKISDEAAKLLILAVNRIRSLRWALDMREHRTQEIIRATPANRHALHELIGIVGTLRAVTSQRIIQTGNLIELKPRRNPVFALDRANKPHLDRLFKLTDLDFNLYAVSDLVPVHIEEHAQGIVAEMKKSSIEGAAGRLFNHVESPSHFRHFLPGFFKCIVNNQLDRNKFDLWMSAAIRRCAFDLFDTEGNFKPDLLRLLNRDGWYNRLIAGRSPEEVEGVKREILYGYFVMPLYCNSITYSQRYQAFAAQVNSDESSFHVDVSQFPRQFFNRTCIRPVQELRTHNYRENLVRIGASLEELCNEYPANRMDNRDQSEVAFFRTFFGEPGNPDIGLFGILISLRRYLAAHPVNVSSEVFYDYIDRLNATVHELQARAETLNQAKQQNASSSSSSIWYFFATPKIQKVVAATEKLVNMIETAQHIEVPNVAAAPRR